MRELNEKEMEVMSSLTDAFNSFCDLHPLHPDENNEFRTVIHQAQVIIMARPMQEIFNKKRLEGKQ